MQTSALPPLELMGTQNGERTSDFPHAHVHVHTQPDASTRICARVCTHMLVGKCVLSLVGFCSGPSIWSGRKDVCAGSDREWSGFKCFKMGNIPIEHRFLLKAPCPRVCHTLQAYAGLRSMLVV